MSDIPRALRWADEPGAVWLLDQTLLPERELELEIRDAEGIADAIASLRVRGAPAIGIAAAMGLYLGLFRFVDAHLGAGREELLSEASRLRALLEQTRPTGRNLTWALRRTVEAVRASPSTDPVELVEVARLEAARVLEEDRFLCDRIGEAGLEVLGDGDVSVLTHCNAGALATGGIGTALAPIYRAHDRGQKVRVRACETRPVLQGARLTAWELSRAGIPVTVITDSMAAAAMRAGDVDLVIVGADAVTANGDVVNKIGTYGLSVLASHHGLPFYVAIPRSTVDRSIGSGVDVPIETRNESEVRGMGGRVVTAPGAEVWNPAFDVTPHHAVTALITDAGVLRPPFGPRLRRLVEGGDG